MKRVLVTGGTGFIGRYAIQRLLDMGYEVHVTTSRQVPASQTAEEYSIHFCDLLDEEQQKQLIEEISPTHLLHFAWDVTHGKFWTTENNLSWVKASINLLQLFNQFGGRRVVYTGTCAEYDWDNGYCVEGVTPLNPSTLYGRCKNGLNEIFQAYCTQENISAAWGRVFHLYGPYEQTSRFVPSVICSMLKQEQVNCSSGTQIRDFMYVEDVADGFVALLDNEAVTGSVNISSGAPVRLKDIVKIIAESTGYDIANVNYEAVAISENDPDLLIGSNKRLRDEVLFTPDCSLKQGLNSSIRWWLSELGMHKA